jgi:hypothetical protein
MDRSLESFYIRDLKEKNKLPIDYFYTFEPLSNPQNNYITNKEVETDNPNEDIWKPEVRIRYGNMTDNNNGLMLIEVTQKFDKDGLPETYGAMLSVKVGFALGNEETGFYHNNLRHRIDIEPDFARLVSMEEYVLRTFRSRDEEVQKYSKKFVKACRTLMELEDVEEVYDRGGRKKRKEKEEHIKNCIEELTRNLPEGITIEVPMEFQEVQSLYK